MALVSQAVEAAKNNFKNGDIKMFKAPQYHSQVN